MSKCYTFMVVERDGVRLFERNDGELGQAVMLVPEGAPLGTTFAVPRECFDAAVAAAAQLEASNPELAEQLGRLAEGLAPKEVQRSTSNAQGAHPAAAGGAVPAPAIPPAAALCPACGQPQQPGWTSCQQCGAGQQQPKPFSGFAQGAR